MKAVRLTLGALAAIAFVLAAGPSVFGFHSGGVAECAGCHSMHNPFPAGGSLLKGGDPSATCLACHQSAGDAGPSSYHVSTPAGELLAGVSPKQRTPGGDFGWLNKDYSWAGRGGVIEEEAGHTHGHNIVANQGFARDGVTTVTYEYEADPVNTLAPGGDFAAANLGCESCHDPHGQYRRNQDGTITKTGRPIANSGSYKTSAAPTADVAVGVYRLLGGSGYQGDIAAPPFPGAPDAVAPNTYNQSEATNQVKVAYGRSTAPGHATWSEWCGTCHGEMHYDNGAEYTHKTDEQLNGLAANYNAYIKSGDLGGVQASSFTSLVPFVHNTGDYAVLAAAAGNGSPTYGGPTNTDRIDCLSCHRAHASAWEYAVRWNPEYELLTDATGNYFNGSYGGRGRTVAEVEDSYYDRPSTVFAKSQRSLCNKCHVKD